MILELKNVFSERKPTQLHMTNSWPPVKFLSYVIGTKKTDWKKSGNAIPDQEIVSLPSSPPSIIPEFIDETIKAGIIHKHPDVYDGWYSSLRNMPLTVALRHTTVTALSVVDRNLNRRTKEATGGGKAQGDDKPTTLRWNSKQISRRSRSRTGVGMRSLICLLISLLDSRGILLRWKARGRVLTT